MKTTIHKIALTSLLAVGCHGLLNPAAFAADKQLPTIEVAKTLSTGVAYWQPAMGEGLAQMLVTELNNCPNFKVLESLALEDLRDERRLGESGEVSAFESVKKGQWKEADYTFKSTVTRFGCKENNFGGGGWAPHLPGGFGFGNFGVKVSTSEVQIDWRIIDNASREVVPGASGRAVGIQKGTGFNFNSWGGGGFSNDREFMDSALGKATMKAIADIVAKVKTLEVGPGARTLNRETENAQKTDSTRQIKGTVAMVDGRDVWVGLGSNNGFKSCTNLPNNLVCFQRQ